MTAKQLATIQDLTLLRTALGCVSQVSTPGLFDLGLTESVVEKIAELIEHLEERLRDDSDNPSL